MMRNDIPCMAEKTIRDVIFVCLRPKGHVGFHEGRHLIVDRGWEYEKWGKKKEDSK